MPEQVYFPNILDDREGYFHPFYDLDLPHQGRPFAMVPEIAARFPILRPDPELRVVRENDPSTVSPRVQAILDTRARQGAEDATAAETVSPSSPGPTDPEPPEVAHLAPAETVPSSSPAAPQPHLPTNISPRALRSSKHGAAARSLGLTDADDLAQEHVELSREIDLHCRRHVFPLPDRRVEVHVRDVAQCPLQPLHRALEGSLLFRAAVAVRHLGEGLKAEDRRHMVQDGSQEHRCRHVAAVCRREIDLAT